MGDPPITRPSLLLRVRDHQDHEAWRQFAELYAPLVYQIGRKRGLQDADAADLTQIVFQEVAKEIRRLDYDSRRGTFRGWLWTVVRNQLQKYVVRQQQVGARGEGGDSGSLGELPQRQTDEQLWEQEYQRRLFRWAAERVRDHVESSSWQAFWQTAVEGNAAKEVADKLGMSIGAVYTAKSRVLERVKRTIEEVSAAELPLNED